MEIVNNILLLGNGFDLSIGLKSKFSDYIIYSIEKYIKLDDIKSLFKNCQTGEERLQNFFSFLNDNKILQNIDSKKFITDNWLILLCFYEADSVDFEKINWADIEKNLTKYICSPAEFGKDIPLNNMNKFKNQFRPHPLLFYPTNNKIKAEKINEHIKNFTDHFVEYIKTQINDDERKTSTDKKNLKTKAHEKLSTILNYVSPEHNFKKNGVNTYILNFNYTNWFKSCLDKNDLLIQGETTFEVNSIHGNIDNKGSCIIGIDDKKVNFSLNAAERCLNHLTDRYVFSKTYKRLLQSQNSLPLPRNNGFTNIIFCGLSLSENDDVYYDSIFNTYDIYNNKNVKIYFVFLNEYDYYPDVYKLLKKYSENFDNKLHGNTLITKLLIEGRLSIIKIK